MFTKNNARVFQFTGKKDLVSAFCYAYCAFRIWLVRHAATPQLPDEDIAGCAAF